MEFNIDMTKISGVLKEYRTLHGLTQREIAEELDIETKYYGQIERGERVFTLENLIHLCKYFKISLDSLISSPSESEINAELKERQLSNIMNQLRDCSSNELAIINNLIHDVLLHLQNP